MATLLLLQLQSIIIYPAVLIGSALLGNVRSSWMVPSALWIITALLLWFFAMAMVRFTTSCLMSPVMDALPLFSSTAFQQLLPLLTT